MKRHLLLFFTTYAILFANTLTFAYNSNKKVSITLLNIENYKTFSLLSYNYGCLDKTIHNFENWKKESNSNPSLKEIRLDTKLAATPTITSFAPSIGNPGTLVTITGTNLGNPTAFTIGGATAIVVSNTGSTLVGMVMPGSASGTISISTGSGTATSSGTFTVTTTPYPSPMPGNTEKYFDGYSQGSAVSADGNTVISTKGTTTGGVYFDIIPSLPFAPYLNAYQAANFDYLENPENPFGEYYNPPSSFSLSADGKTALLGYALDSDEKGAAFVYTRNGDTWEFQAKLVGDGIGALQGRSVSLSADGNTALIGGPSDVSNPTGNGDIVDLNGNGQGGAWVFIRNGGIWSQQGGKLVGTGASGLAQQGRSVSLSADGNTALVGGPGDDGGIGAAWVYTRSGITWTQQGSKMVGAGALGSAKQGGAVAISADGNVVMVGGSEDNGQKGAVWTFTRSVGNWFQLGDKLVNTDSNYEDQMGAAVSISADGKTALVGGLGFNGVNAGGVRVFTRNGSTWLQKTMLNSDVWSNSVSLSPDGKYGLITLPSRSRVELYESYFNVAYSGNGNTYGSVPDPTVGTVKEPYVNLSSNSGMLVKEGYAFDGWNTKQDGSGTSYPEGAVFIERGTIILYAQWKLNSITFNANGGFGAMSNQSIYYGTSVNLTINTFTLSGLSFIGWNT
ncbi:MAG: InlB B-repeat-containing protein, partial [Flavobacterium sp.]|nr:InlB B-repeat-containing protein [Flavobacterium sp.]